MARTGIQYEKTKVEITH